MVASNSWDTPNKNAWTDQFPYMYGIYYSDTANKIFNGLNIDNEKTFSDLSIYRDFKNIQHFTYILNYPYFRNHSTCEILKLLPHIKTVSIGWTMLLEAESDNCLSESKVGVIIRGGVYDLEKKIPKSKIIGMENYSEDLKELYKFPHLAYLGITDYSSSQGKLEELSERINITHFSMSSKGTKGISNLGNLVNLSYLNLTCILDEKDSKQSPCESSYIKDINFLKKLRWLTELKLNHHQLKDITPIENLKYLEAVELKGNNIEYIPDLKNLTQLKVLDLGGNKIQKITNIKDLKSLQLLDASSNQISDFSPLSGLDKLTHLNISNNIFKTTFGSFKPPTSLKVLVLNGSSPEYDDDCWTSHNEEFLDEIIIGPSKHFQEILMLDFEYPDRTYKPFMAEDINLQNFENLEILSLRNNNFKNVPQLNYLKKLKYLDLAGNNIKKVPGNVLLSELMVLDLSNNKMEQVLTLHQFPKLKKLDLDANKISKLNPFIPPSSLSLVSFNTNLLTDVNVLAKPIYKNLRLELQENPVVDTKSHCPFKTPNEDLNWYCNILVNKPDPAEKFD